MSLSALPPAGLADEGREQGAHLGGVPAPGAAAVKEPVLLDPAPPGHRAQHGARVVDRQLLPLLDGHLNSTLQCYGIVQYMLA